MCKCGDRDNTRCYRPAVTIAAAFIPKARRHNVPLAQLHRDLLPAPSSIPPQRRLTHHRLRHCDSVDVIRALDVLRRRRGVGVSLRARVRPAKLDDGEGVEDCPREAARAALWAERARKRVARPGPVPFWVPDRPDRLRMGGAQRGM